ncbi:MAG: DUF2937 family protein [Parvularculaceae bacterium]|nr:DUF2937 family protein [Parvularculaceae bacterium]
MFGRLLALIAGAALAVAASQGPAFSDQYMQNLTGRIDELQPIVEEFDAKVGEYNYSRAAAMAECSTASGLLEALCSTYETIVNRYETLLAHMAELNAASIWTRPLVLARTYKKDIAESVYSAFKPAVPATPEGFAYGGGGFLAGYIVPSILFGLLGAMFGGGRRYA